MTRLIKRFGWRLLPLMLWQSLALAAPPVTVTAAEPDASTQYALWSALITHGLGADAKTVVIAQRTTDETSAVLAPGAKLEEVAKKLDVSPTLLKAWVEANQTSLTLERQLSLRAKYHLLDDKARADIFTGEDAATNWGRFRAKFPDAPGLLRLSRTAVDAPEGHALAYIEFTCGPACGSGRLIRAVRKGKNWTVLSGELIWIARP